MGTLKKEIEESRKRLLEKIANRNEEPEIELEPTRKRKTVKEENKELRESRKEKIDARSFSERYEEFLKEELFKNEPNIDDSDENEISYDLDKFAHVKRDGLWDVLSDEEIHYFDPELSYEITGYRPITETEGLDFDPLPFSEAGRIFEETGSYTEYPPGYKSYVDFWTEQVRRCAEGHTIGNYRITGDHYFFLNFYRMQTVPKGIAGKGRNEGFPSFHAKQYEFFHYIDLCEATKKDAILLKARALKSWRPITKKRIGK